MRVNLPQGHPNIYSQSLCPSPLRLVLHPPPLPSTSTSSLHLRTPAVAQSSAKLSGGGGEKQIFPPHFPLESVLASNSEVDLGAYLEAFLGVS
jgi:hypothetical protein